MSVCTLGVHAVGNVRGHCRACSSTPIRHVAEAVRFTRAIHGPRPAGSFAVHIGTPADVVRMAVDQAGDQTLAVQIDHVESGHSRRGLILAADLQDFPAAHQQLAQA